MFIKTRIREYDIKECNISILRKNNVISIKDYEVLQRGKDRRLIFVGNLIKDDPSIYELISSTTKTIINKFILLNGVDTVSIDEICFDAIWIFGPKFIKHIDIDGYDVRCKQEFTSILEVGKMKFYYHSLLDKFTCRYVASDIKEDKNLMILIKTIMGLLECGDTVKTYTLIHNYNKTINKYSQFIHDMLDELDV